MERAQEIIATHDKNGSKTISFDEFIVMMEEEMAGGGGDFSGLLGGFSFF